MTENNFFIGLLGVAIIEKVAESFKSEIYFYGSISRRSAIIFGKFSIAKSISISVLLCHNSNIIMQNVQILENQNAVVIPMQRWKKMQSEIASLKKRLKKAEMLNDFRKSLTDLNHDLQDENYDVTHEVLADDFLAELNNVK